MIAFFASSLRTLFDSSLYGSLTGSVKEHKRTRRRFDKNQLSSNKLLFTPAEIDSL